LVLFPLVVKCFMNIPVYGAAFANVDVSNAITLQNALSDMAVGMSTALWTTLIGLVCSLIIKVQLVNLEVALNE
jgi:hypothetical protein